MLFVVWVGVAGVVGKQIQAWWVCYGEVERVGTGAEWPRFEGRDRKARADLLPQERAAARRDQTVKRLNWGFGLGRAWGEGIRRERRRVRAEARASVSGCRLANLSSSGLMRQQKARLKQKASFKAGPASRLLLC